MNLKELGVRWRSDELGLTLWMHPGKFFNKWSIVRTVLDRNMPPDEDADANDNHLINNLRAAFIYLEAFVLDYECDEGCNAKIVEYLKNRSAFNITRNLELFLTTLEYNDVRIVFDAFDETRPVVDTENEESLDTEAKKKPLESKS